MNIRHETCCYGSGYVGSPKIEVYTPVFRLVTPDFQFIMPYGLVADIHI